MNKDKERFVPDYNGSCFNCGQSPTVTVVDGNGIVVTDFEMCGPCTFGEASAVYPESWGEIK